MKKKHAYMFFPVTILLAFVARILPYKNAFLGGNIIFTQPDAYYHLRRATLIIKNFPAYPTLDRYMAYPYGAESPWPPLYDWLIGVISLLVGLGNPGHQTIHTVTTLLCPLIGAFTVIPLFLLTRLLFGERPALLAGLFAVVMPGQLSYSIIGSGDHHTAELFLLLYTFYFFLKGNLPAGDGAGTAGWRNEFIAGLFLAVAVLVWQGSIVFGTVLAVYAAVRMALAPRTGPEGPGGSSSRLIVGATVTLGTAAALTAAVRTIIPPGTEQGVFNFGFFSYFQPVYLLALCVSLWVFSLAVSATRNASRRLWVALGAAVVVTAAAFLVPAMRQNILDGIRFILRKDPYLASINEFQPLFTGSPVIDLFLRGRWDARVFWEILYMAGFFLPPLHLIALWRRRKTDGWGGKETFYAIWTVLFFLLALEQKRWANAYAGNVSVGVGWLFTRIFEKSQGLSRAWREFLEWKERQHGADRPKSAWVRLFVFSNRSPWMVASFAFFIFLVPYQMLLYSFLAVPGLPIDADIYNSLIWLRENTPRTSYLDQPARKPEYSVMAEWDYGHWIQYIAERPTVANNYGYQLRGDGLGDSVRFALAGSEEEAVRLCEKRGVRFVFATDVFYPMHDLGWIVGVDYGERFSAPPIPHGGSMSTIDIPNDVFYTQFYQKMYYFDGGAYLDNVALTRFRLVFESKNPTGLPFGPPDTKRVKIFEFVKGAVVEGTGDPNTYVTCAVRLQTSWGRLFDFVSATVSDSRGRFSMRIPYASKNENYFIRPVSRFLVIGGNRAQFLDIGNEDVLLGKTVRADLKRKGFRFEEHRRVREGAGPGEAVPGVGLRN